MLNLILAGAGYLFPASRILNLSRNGINMTSSTNPVILSKNVTLMVIDCCSFYLLKLIAYCVMASSLIGVSLLIFDLITVGLAIHVTTEIHGN